MENQCQHVKAKGNVRVKLKNMAHKKMASTFEDVTLLQVGLTWIAFKKICLLNFHYFCTDLPLSMKFVQDLLYVMNYI